MCERCNALRVLCSIRDGGVQLLRGVLLLLLALAHAAAVAGVQASYSHPTAAPSQFKISNKQPADLQIRGPVRSTLPVGGQHWATRSACCFASEMVDCTQLFSWCLSCPAGRHCTCTARSTRMRTAAPTLQPQQPCIPGCGTLHSCMSSLLSADAGMCAQQVSLPACIPVVSACMHTSKTNSATSTSLCEAPQGVCSLPCVVSPGACCCCLRRGYRGCIAKGSTRMYQQQALV